MINNYKELKDIFQAQNLKEYLHCFIYFISNLTLFKEYLVQLTKKIIIKNFKHVIPSYTDHLIKLASNK